MIWYVYILWNDHHNKLISITTHSTIFFLRWELLQSTLLETFNYTILLTIINMLYITSPGFICGNLCLSRFSSSFMFCIKTHLLLYPNSKTQVELASLSFVSPSFHVRISLSSDLEFSIAGVWLDVCLPHLDAGLMQILELSLHYSGP